MEDWKLLSPIQRAAIVAASMDGIDAYHRALFVLLAECADPAATPKLDDEMRALVRKLATSARAAI